MSKHGFVLLLAALVGCKYAALPSLSGNHGDAPPGIDGKSDGSADGGHADGAAPDSPPDAAICPATSACIEAPMPGWNGPAIFYENAAGMSSPACSGDYDVTALVLNGGLDGGTATCSCSCGAASGTSCGNATLGTYSQVGCVAANPLSSQTLPPGACESFTLGAANYYNLAVPNVTGGSCTASLNKNIPPATWSTQFRACTSSAATTSAGCTADQVCAPRPSAPADSQICIYASGDVACPSGSSYSNRLVRYESYTDTRDCASSCSCGAPSGSCGGQVSLTDGPTTPTCGTNLDAHVLPGCHAVSPGNATNVKYDPVPAATCTPSSNTVTGTLSGAQPTTLCCLTPP